MKRAEKTTPKNRYEQKSGAESEAICSSQPTDVGLVCARASRVIHSGSNKLREKNRMPYYRMKNGVNVRWNWREFEWWFSNGQGLAKKVVVERVFVHSTDLVLMRLGREKKRGNVRIVCGNTQEIKGLYGVLLFIVAEKIKEDSFLDYVNIFLTLLHFFYAMPFARTKSKRLKKSEISSPSNFEHRIHAVIDPNTGTLTGLPRVRFWTLPYEGQKFMHGP